MRDFSYRAAGFPVHVSALACDTLLLHPTQNWKWLKPVGGGRLREPHEEQFPLLLVHSFQSINLEWPQKGGYNGICCYTGTLILKYTVCL